MTVTKCDRCGTVEVTGKTLAGTVSRASIGHLTNRYPDKYDLCWVCAKELESILADWWKEGD